MTLRAGQKVPRGLDYRIRDGVLEYFLKRKKEGVFKVRSEGTGET
jgi:hypothetical protein